MKLVVALALVLAGCLSEPDPPPGHQVEIRGTLVVDFNRDGYDDLIMWGHADDPRKSGTLWVDPGSPSGLTFGADHAIALSGDSHAQWHEVLAVTPVVDTHSAQDTPTGLVVLLGEDAGLPPSGQASRVARLVQLPTSANALGAPNYGPGFAAPSIGGYGGSLQPASVSAFVGPSDTEEALVTSRNAAWHGALDGMLANVDLATQNDSYFASFALPSDTTTHRQALLLVTDHHEFVLDGTVARANPVMLSDSEDRYGTAHMVGDSLVIANVPQIHHEISFAKYSQPTQVLTTSTLSTMADANDVGVTDISGDGTPDVFALEGALVLYGGIDMSTPTATPAFTAHHDAGGSIVVAGHFGDSEVVYVFNDQLPDGPTDCYRVDVAMEMFIAC